ncbi:carboxypeptidase-like regulatory domain-containing protein [Paucihalobacter sp.]|uniref:carboxypeptidase-like regulatory domain-containing protein n=1 Tax=Paucihalobacter sp. TaxID=2850405 RepID=UPI002FE1FA7E
MIKFIATTVFTFFSIFILHSQSLSAIIVEKTNGNPIPFAAVKIDEYNGVISNDEGVFTINNPNVKSVIISCLGFQELEISIENIRKANYKIELEASVNQLNEIIISNKLPNLDSIIFNIRKNFKHNHDLANTELEIFSRGTYYFDFENFGLDVKKAQALPKKSVSELNTAINQLTSNVVSSKSKSFNDFSGNLFITDSIKTKLIPKQSTVLIDIKNDYSVEKVQEKSQLIFLKALDTNLTYKVRTGIFKVEDSLSLKSTKAKDKAPIHNVDELKSRVYPLLSNIHNFENTIIGKILDTKFYDFSIRDVAYTDGSMAYVIDFTPRKGKAKYAGTLIVMANNYALKRFDYSFAEGKRGTKVNLKLIAGVKYVEEGEFGSIHFEKDSNDKYKPFYIQQNKINYIYVNRSITFIENSKAKNKFGFEILIEGRTVEKKEMLVTNSQNITHHKFSSVEEPKNIEYTKLNKYTPSIWENQQVLEPLEDMKTFVVKE